MAIQESMGRENYHLFSFRLPQFKTDFDEEIKASWSTSISDYFGFGDGVCSGGAGEDYDLEYFDPDEVEFSNFDEALPP